MVVGKLEIEQSAFKQGLTKYLRHFSIFNSLLMGKRTIVKPLFLPVVMTCKVVVGSLAIGDKVVVGISVEINNSVVGVSVVVKTAVEDTSVVVLWTWVVVEAACVNVLVVIISKFVNIKLIMQKY